MISYDDFAKVEMKIGEILTVEVVPNADKLLRLTVDVGEKTPRQIISGIREYVDDPQALVGVRCPFVTNLAPRIIRGLESEGMILAARAEDPTASSDAKAGGTFALLRPTAELPAGTRLS